jgi:hypothetical protein
MNSAGVNGFTGRRCPKNEKLESQLLSFGYSHENIFEVLVTSLS